MSGLPEDVREAVSAVVAEYEYALTSSMSWSARVNARAVFRKELTTLTEHLERLERDLRLAWEVRDAYQFEKEQAEARGRELEEALLVYDRWASSMPDALFTDKDPRWGWWHRRPYDIARAALEKQ